MGDSTPEVNCLGRNTSKYLTPCRTFGLKRRNTPKSDPGKKIKSENDSCPIIRTAVDDSSISRNINAQRACLSPLNGLHNKTNKAHVLFTNAQSESKVKSDGNDLSTPKRSSNLHNTIMRKEKFRSEFNNASKSLETPHEAESIKLEAQIKRINEKIIKLEKLKRDEIYARKHNLMELRKSSDKWLSSFKEIAHALHSELTSRGRECSLLDVLLEHSIPTERVGFNEDTQEFD